MGNGRASHGSCELVTKDLEPFTHAHHTKDRKDAVSRGFTYVVLREWVLHEHELQYWHAAQASEALECDEHATRREPYSTPIQKLWLLAGDWIRTLSAIACSLSFST